MKNFLQRCFVLFLLISSLCILIQHQAGVVHAQSASSTTIIPPSFELFANPGDSLREKISIRNESPVDNIYNISSEDFEADGDTGQVDLVKGDSSRTYSLASWITADTSSVTVKAHSESAINFVINVPQGAEPGGHYGAVSIQSGSGTTPGAANVSAGQVSLILLRVSGTVTEKAKILGFSAPSYSEYGPIPITLKLENDGGVHIKPTGTIIITDIFGAKVDEIQLDGRNILPSAQRAMATYWNKKNPIGKYTATLVATYGEQHSSLLASTSFIVFPKPLAIGIGIAIICLLIVIFMLISGRKRIAKALKVIAQG